MDPTLGNKRGRTGSLDLLSIDDDLDLNIPIDSDNEQSEPCSCFPLSLDPSYDILCDPCTFQVCLGHLNSVWLLKARWFEKVYIEDFSNLHNNLWRSMSSYNERDCWKSEFVLWYEKSKCTSTTSLVYTYGEKLVNCYNWKKYRCLEQEAFDYNALPPLNFFCFVSVLKKDWSNIYFLQFFSVRRREGYKMSH